MFRLLCALSIFVVGLFFSLCVLFAWFFPLRLLRLSCVLCFFTPLARFFPLIPPVFPLPVTLGLLRWLQGHPVAQDDGFRRRR